MRADVRSAVVAGDVESFAQLVSDDPSAATARDPQGLSPLVLACYHGRTEIADFLLAREPELDLFEAATVGYGARVAELLATDPAQLESYSPDGFTPLQLAAYFGRTSATKLLLERGANVDSVSANAMRIHPLHAAAASRRLDVAELLLAGGADPNARQHGGHTPLHAAAQNGDVPLVKLLLDHGADRSLRNEAGRSPLDLVGEDDEATRALLS